ncbi:MAG: hypothetical protein IT383_09970 [Deltaproteobacteria bacterium]|nr:hypothetical protein [Deltaproteobacteria bacterium]
MTEKFTPEQQKQLDELSEQFDQLLEKHQGHPIIKAALAVCTTEEGLPWRPKLQPEAIKYLEDILVECDKDGTIGWATHGLIAVANYLDSKKAGMVAYEILNLANNTVIKYDLVERQEKAKRDWAKRQDKGQKEAIAATGGESKVANAPKLGEKPPPGTVKGGALGPKRRI